MAPPRTAVLRTDALVPGAVLAGRFRIERVLGRGGMGLVLAAFHLQLERRVAIKVVLPEMAKTEAVLARFFREAKAAARIESEHVARVIDVGYLDGGAPFMVMEYLEGQDLSEVLRARGPLPLVDAVRWVLEACEGLAAAHRAGIIHRDLKPQNLFLAATPDGAAKVKVLDFGISKATLLERGEDPALTREASTLGSPAYMSPEQLRSSRDVDVRTDVWSMGVVLHELLSGRTAFGGQTLPELHVAILSQPPTSVRAARPELPAGIEAIVARCLEKEPARRFPTVAELALALADFGPRDAGAHADRAARILGVPTRGQAPTEVCPTPGLSAPPLPPTAQAAPLPLPAGPPPFQAPLAPLSPPGQPYPGAAPYGYPVEQRAPSAGMTLATIALILLVGALVIFGGGCVLCLAVAAS